MTAMDLARVVIAELVAGGVADVVVAPGSRNAPLGFAAWQAAERGELALHVRIDERDAGFTALGLAIGGGRPVAVITTSGTAVANLHPAVLEAAHGRRPLIVISADRPGYLIGSGANQTTDQRGIFAPAVRDDAQLADADDQPGHWRFAVRRLLAAATGLRDRRPGPVHLNVALRPPLVPGPADRELAPARPFRAEPAPAPDPVRLPAAPRTVVLAGDADPAVGAAARALAEAAGLPLLAEPSSNARAGGSAIGAYRLLLDRFADRIERVIGFGHPTLSRPVSRLLAREDVELIMVSPTADWIDPGLAADRVVDAVIVDGRGDPGWLVDWRTADAELGAALVDALDRAGAITGPALGAAVWSALSGVTARGDVLVLGSSNPVRDVDLAPIGEQAPVTFANRGLAGIDGTVATAAGIALGAGRPVQLLVGDLTFLHDVNGLLLGPDEPRPDLRIIVANDDGGSIFATLEQGAPEHAGAFERIFGTPHGTDLAALAAAYRVPYQRIDDLSVLGKQLARAPRGIEMIEVPLDRTGRRELDQRLRSLGRGESPG
ncbi:2-succinyl-5-enolpyruvyl-6-hydroxy-3-cyclohexene-1-carboxylate synthase [Naumannella cuiyingiana]|uniref:2-succinyl-5-enolpyruvyl-6-hydroxy-3-cyclohexene-1-carboxylate synthase n=1 Tax=Naumannella cuiyingiana TaxID=1347891 RepID=A0A7Z0D8D1_9ACTN|nr:2-succinyl-5-enolpyruvyl-6-hydroxy-3-cyclohexene-1-carboxylic-acid synthase [Naumannella cuiyingiana]NYI70621.1 2-succinyl-5-enolpyruvyl-6-hydroxy-3-cyclohexene-1-carboxylate synthase [Naumannella cuiyingiana]